MNVVVERLIYWTLLYLDEDVRRDLLYLYLFLTLDVCIPLFCKDKPLVIGAVARRGAIMISEYVSIMRATLITSTLEPELADQIDTCISSAFERTESFKCTNLRCPGIAATTVHECDMHGVWLGPGLPARSADWTK